MLEYSTEDLLLALDSQIDSLGRRYRGKDPVLERKLNLCLGLVRRLMARFPQHHHTLKRWSDKRELPTMPRGTRDLTKRNWKAYKRKRDQARWTYKTLQL